MFNLYIIIIGTTAVMVRMDAIEMTWMGDNVLATCTLLFSRSSCFVSRSLTPRSLWAAKEFNAKREEMEPTQRMETQTMTKVKTC